MNKDTKSVTVAQIGAEMALERARMAAALVYPHKLTKPRRRHTKLHFNTISTPTKGTIAELQISIDLLKRGFPVFRALSPSCPCDLAIVVDGKLLRIEVTSAKQGPNGRPYYSKHNPENFDVLALVFDSGKIQYIPDL